MSFGLKVLFLFFFFMCSVIFQSEYVFGEEECRDCTVTFCPKPDDIGCGHSYFIHPCFCCPTCLPVDKESCPILCPAIPCPNITCPNGSYKVPGMCCPDCLK
ncbi:hypothetical protein Anas_03689 [Armadillidium nasatum]|uniref:Cysteine-rich motor neuron 1 protein n=1 Tax=Armadillidium nasatum TaxID=96803 RepID=A0A5N5SR36_9CRUS|nr:hypothetical protein Anas_03689 [Armadillidium nasatum]